LAERKAHRDRKRQLGQFMTPVDLARLVVGRLELTAQTRVLEPSFGDGSFLIAVIERLMSIGEGTPAARLERILTKQLFGVEIDAELAAKAVANLESRWWPLPDHSNLLVGDFFSTEFFHESFDLVLGNPPYGGTFDPAIEDRLDRAYGRWDGHKLKKETYAFFIARALDLLAPQGALCFISSDTFTTISTMGGLRRRLMDETSVDIEHLAEFSAETTQPTLILTASKTGRSEAVEIDSSSVGRVDIERTGNFSWRVDSDLARYFHGPTLADFVVGTGGMTIGRNEYFVRELTGGDFVEPFEFEFFDDPITLSRELARARLGKLSPKVQARILQEEAAGDSRRNVRVTRRQAPLRLTFPHPDYRPYNKADSSIVYAPPKHIVYWKDGGDAVLTFKRNGNWYLHGVGGQPYFLREGLTWHLISSSIRMRYLPPGYILDSGAPCAFLRSGIDASELWLILGWCLTREATRIMKTVINHTRNIQSKDIERLPYPWWVSADTKNEVIRIVSAMVHQAQSGRTFDSTDGELSRLDALFEFPQRAHALPPTAATVVGLSEVAIQDGSVPGDRAAA
jgi:tRNA1(Val) A37 N6-methylase TrmN6